jgi:photosystem II stability/assembly factor-like uncharacterized protein
MITRTLARCIVVALLASLPAAAAASSSISWVPFSPSVGGSAGKLNAFAYVQSDPSVMYVAGGWGNTPRESPSQAGIYRTTDGGRHWTPIDDGLTNPDGTISSVVNGLWLDQSNPKVVLASTEFAGTFRSTDGGDHWKLVDRSESTQFAQVGAVLYLASRRGVLKSTNDGATWKVSLPALGGATTVATAGGATYAGMATGQVYRLHGSGWKKAGRPGTGATHNLAVDPFNANIVYANVDDERAWNQVLYATIDGGQHWKRIHCFCSIGAQAIAFSLTTPDRVYMGDDGGGSILYFAADGNARPSLSRGAGTEGADMRYIFPVATGSTTDACYFATDQGMYLATSCTSGQPTGLTNDVPNFLAYDATLAPATGLIIALQDYGAVTANGKGKDVKGVGDSGEGGETAIDPYDSKHCYFVHPDFGLYISTDGCASFGRPATAGIESLTFAPPDGATMYAVTNADRGGAAVSTSTDGGNTWQATGWKFFHPYLVVVSPTDPKTIVVATGNATEPPKLFVSHDGGSTWQKARGLANQGGPSNAEIYFPTHRYFVAFEPGASNANTLVLSDHDPATDNILIYRSADNGATFAYQTTFDQPSTQRQWPNLIFPEADERPAPEINYYATRFYGNRLAFNQQATPSQTPALVLTTRFGAFLSADAATTWSRIDTTAIAHHFIGVSWVNGYVYLASFGEGVLKSAAPLQ